MNGPSDAADLLRPVSRTEAVALAGGLQKHIDRHPLAAEDPVVALVTRLVLSLPAEGGETRDEATNKYVGVLQLTIRELESELSDREARLNIANLACDELRGKLDAQSTTDDYGVILAERDDAVAALNQLKGEHSRLAAHQVEDSQRLNASLTTLEQEVRSLKALAEEQAVKKAKVEGYLTDLRNRVKGASRAVNDMEWRGKHTRHRAQGGLAAKCCPLCLGLSTEYAATNQIKTGHEPACLFTILHKVLKPG
jgi:DNA repair exonuclease SbcCD ATPase subunit